MKISYFKDLSDEEKIIILQYSTLCNVEFKYKIDREEWISYTFFNSKENKFKVFYSTDEISGAIDNINTSRKEFSGELRELLSTFVKKYMDLGYPTNEIELTILHDLTSLFNEIRLENAIKISEKFI